MTNQEPERITDFIIALSPHNRQRGIDMIEGLVKRVKIEARVEERQDMENLILKAYTTGREEGYGKSRECLNGAKKTIDSTTYEHEHWNQEIEKIISKLEELRKG